MVRGVHTLDVLLPQLIPVKFKLMLYVWTHNHIYSKLCYMSEHTIIFKLMLYVWTHNHIQTYVICLNTQSYSNLCYMSEHIIIFKLMLYVWTHNHIQTYVICLNTQSYSNKCYMSDHTIIFKQILYVWTHNHIQTNVICLITQSYLNKYYMSEHTIIFKLISKTMCGILAILNIWYGWTSLFKLVFHMYYIHRSVVYITYNIYNSRTLYAVPQLHGVKFCLFSNDEKTTFGFLEIRRLFDYRKDKPRSIA